MPDTTTIPMQCRHVFTDGHRCLGHCLRHQDFCYFHHTSRRPVENPSARRRRGTTFTLPELEDRAAIQLALSEILQRIASNELDPRRAGHLLYGLQIAASLLPKPDPKQHTVAEITHDPELGDLAPTAEVGADHEPTELERLLNRWLDEGEPETLPTVQAVAEDSRLTPHISNLAARPPLAGHRPHPAPLAPEQNPSATSAFAVLPPTPQTLRLPQSLSWFESAGYTGRDTAAS